MSWKSEVDEIRARREAARAMGGPEAIARQHERGRLTIRERLDHLVDAESLDEQGPIAGEAERDEDDPAKDGSAAGHHTGDGADQQRTCEQPCPRQGYHASEGTG